ncbi:hypothetical protein BDU57DRAFT_514529 [Ampelomyces quisqualis]|uniref:Uncharacterized protein n=1 Tax=Ampelomyces quisqualis TaxID=50730 RepID=A0A6A5QQS9_AMPQU|nr:hypothetical protein BDU57DRAFT_514529 [Ampelomyces quisqualis]
MFEEAVRVYLFEEAVRVYLFEEAVRVYRFEEAVRVYLLEEAVRSISAMPIQLLPPHTSSFPPVYQATLALATVVWTCGVPSTLLLPLAHSVLLP